MDVGPYQEQGLLKWLELQRADSGTLQLVIIDIASEEIAGMLKYVFEVHPHVHANAFSSYTAMLPSHRTMQVGYVFVFPKFQRTHVLTHTLYAILCYALDSKADGGLDWQRVVWTAYPRNARSRTAAKRLGFEEECILKFVLSSFRSVHL